MKKDLLLRTPGVRLIKQEVTDLGYVDPFAAGVVGATEESNDDKNIVEDMNEAASLRIRMATMDAIVDDIVENDIPDAQNEEDLHRVIDPIVDKAVARFYLPASYRGRVNKVIVDALKRRDSMTNLLSKIASFSADELSEIVIDQDQKDDGNEIDIKPLNNEVDVQPDKGDDAIVDKNKNPHEVDTVEIVKDTQNVVTVNDVIDDFAVKESLRLTAVSSVLSKVALKGAIDTFALDAYKHMTTQLRHVLPVTFKKRYNVK